MLKNGPTMNAENRTAKRLIKYYITHFSTHLSIIVFTNISFMIEEGKRYSEEGSNFRKEAKIHEEYPEW